MYIYTYLLIFGLGGGPVGQPPLALNEQEFRRIVLCHQLWLKTEADEIQKDKNCTGHK